MIWRWRPMTVERLTSGWMYWPPVMCHCSSSTSRRTRPKSSGSIRSTCSKSQDSPRVNTNSGYSSQRSAAERNVASASSTPACQDHSHTGSMWALPIMWTITKRPISYVCLRLFLLNYRRRLWPAPKDVLPGLSLDGSGRQSADDEPLQDDEGGDGRQHGQHPARGDHLGRGLGVVALEIEDADRDREQRGFTQEYVRHDELSPGEDRREHEHRGEAWQYERQNNPQERAEARAAVHHGRLVEGWRYAVEEPLKHPGRKRHQDGDVDHRRADVRVEQVPPGEVPVERYDDDQRRNHLQGKHADQLIGVLALQMISPLVVIIPLYRYFARLHLLDSHISTSMVYIAILVPIATWMLKGFFDGIPPALDEAAMVDGCTRFGAFLRVVLPLILPGLTSVFVLTAILAWGEFIVPYILLSKPSLLPISIGILNFQGNYAQTSTQVVAAGGVLAMLPAIA